MILRRMLAIWISKATCVVCKLAGKQGVTLAGKIALKIDPKILMELSGQVRKKIFITCGTNGKTTTNNLLCSAIEAEGEKVICNHTGSSMVSYRHSCWQQNGTENWMRIMRVLRLMRHQQ